MFFRFFMPASAYFVRIAVVLIDAFLSRFELSAVVLINAFFVSF